VIKRTLFAAALLPTAAFAQGAAQNVQTQATDAFGLSLKGEGVGIYNAGNVRGFSPSAAGNIRLDGLYFAVDQPPRLIGSTSIRVGLAALDYDFPAPSGIADQSFESAGDKTLLTVRTGFEQYYSPNLQADLSTPLGKTTSMVLGAAIGTDESEANTDGTYTEFGLLLTQKLGDTVELHTYAGYNRYWGYEDTVDIYMADRALPPRIPRRVRLSPDWGAHGGSNWQTGGVLTWTPDESWETKAGLFYSRYQPGVDYEFFYVGGRADGTASAVGFIEPATSGDALSFEARTTKRFGADKLRHSLTAAIRGRKTFDQFGGDIDLPAIPARIGQQIAYAPPNRLNFTDPQSQDRVEQLVGGLSYRLQWHGVGIFSAGIQKADYTKRFTPGGGTQTSQSSSPWIYNAGLGVQLAPNLIAYGSYSRGFEESGTAPSSAVNRNQPLPAIITTQRELGLRWAIAPKVTLIGGVFDLRRPYAGTDASNVFRFIGERRHRGVEASLSGEVLPGLNVLVGMLYLDATLNGPDRAAQGLGKRPVGMNPFEMQASLNYRIVAVPGLSVDTYITHFADRVASRDNQLNVPSRTVVDLGARYRFQIGGVQASARAQVVNLLNNFGWRVNGDTGFGYNRERTWRLALTADFD
jgi:iron complex outermembrane recepter protein